MLIWKQPFDWRFIFSFAKCDYIVGPPSTFTSWASFYGDVPVYFYWRSSCRYINRII